MEGIERQGEIKADKKKHYTPPQSISRAHVVGLTECELK